MAGYRGSIRDEVWLDNYGTFDTNPVAYEVEGGNITAHWRHTFSRNSQTNGLAYCDWNNREDSQFAAEFRVTCDAEFQHDYKFTDRHSVTWGAGFRTTADRTPVTPTFQFTPADQRLNFFNGFAQYDVNAVPNRLRVTIGSKFEHSTYGGFDAHPQGRAVLKLAKSHHIWGALSRSTRVPTRSDHDNLVRFFGPLQPPNPPTLISYVGNPNLESEHQTAYELGYRYNHGQTWSLDVAAFYNAYTHSIHPDFTNPIVTFNPFPAYLQLTAPFINDVPVQTHGLEVNSKWKATKWWKLELNVTEDRGTSFGAQAMPRHQSSLRSQWDLWRHWNFDSAFYHSSPVSAGGVVQVDAPAGNRVDAGLSWRGMRGLNVGLWGRNLQSDRHIEGNGIVVENGLVRRAVVGKVSWDFSPDKKP